MKRCLAVFSVAVVFAVLSIMTASAGEPAIPQGKVVSQTAPQTSTFVVTIVKLDVAARSIVVKDKNGKLWDFIVDPKYGIDLSKYKVGDTVTATVATVTDTTNPLMKARISKQELLRLQ
ncbi:MAG: hypothetical protein HY911_05050 [Desulfobacterales bacterium]|nr:hypothetical protein [Desulfobacterales bacterium]